MDVILANCSRRVVTRASYELLRIASTPRQHSNPHGLHGLLKLPSSTVIQKRNFFLLPFGLDFALAGTIAYNVTKLKRPDPVNVLSIFGPVPGSKESELYPEKVVNCIAHRGAGLDAPENTLEAFKNCIEQNCKFFEFDVRSSKDGKLVLLHDQGLQRLTGSASTVSDVQIMDWESIRDIDIAVKHPNRQQFKEVRLCLLDDALDYLLEKDAKMIMDIKGHDKTVIEGILNVYKNRPELYKSAAIASFNPYVLYQIRKRDPDIVGAMSFRPYSFSNDDYNADIGPFNPRTDHLIAYYGLVGIDLFHELVWRWVARYCGVSAVLLHKDIVCPKEIKYWQDLNIRCAGWCVNSPIEKLYWSGILKTPYMANTLLGEPTDGDRKILDTDELPQARKTLLE